MNFELQNHLNKYNGDLTLTIIQKKTIKLISEKLYNDPPSNSLIFYTINTCNSSIYTKLFNSTKLKSTYSDYRYSMNS